MELDGRHLHRPDDVGWVVHAELVSVPVEAREVDTYGFDPRRRTSRQPLLVHLLPVYAVRETVQHAGPVVQRVDDAVSDRQVVAREIELGLAPLREIDPIGVADLDDSITDLEFHALRGHAGTLPWRSLREAPFARSRRRLQRDAGTSNGRVGAVPPGRGF